MVKEVVYKPNEKAIKFYAGGTTEPQKFMPTYYEWLATKGTQVKIMKRHQTVGIATSVDLYTVPVGSTFFITGMAISISCNGAVASARTSLIQIKDDWIIEVAISGVGDSNTVSLPFLTPIRANSEDLIKGVQSNDLNSSYSIHGFLLPNSTPV